MNTSNKKITAKDFDDAFETGDVTEFLDQKSIKAEYPTHRINIDIPQNVLDEIDREAAKIGITRTAMIKVWLSDRIKDKAA